MTYNVLQELVETIHERRAAATGTSYTKQLIEKGTLKCAKKVGEEAVEVALAAVAEDDDAVAGEAADLIYHLLVLLEARDIPFDAVLTKLADRKGRSGIAEKASRSTAPAD
ncbi:MAG: phosphoribosyl-ATP diphosphatase [Pseudomonadota bacterium]